METGKMEGKKAREILPPQMVKSMWVNLKMVIWMDGARTTTQMGIPTMETGKMIPKTVRELSLTPMAKII